MKNEITNIAEPLSDSDRKMIAAGAKELISEIVQVCENPDPDRLKTLFIDSPDFVSLVGGICADYEQSLKSMYAYLNAVKRQKATIRDEKYSVIDENTILYSANSRWEATLQNDSIAVMDPCGMQFLLRKDNDQWRILSWTEEY